MKKEVKWDRTALIVEVCCIILVGLLDLSLCWMDGMLAYHKVLVVLVNVVGIIIFPWLLLHFAWTRDAVEKALADLEQGWQKIRKDHQKIIKYAAYYVGLWLGLGVIVRIATHGTVFPWWKYYFFAGCASLILTFWLMRRQMAEKTEGAFAVTALILGLTFILSSPRIVGVCWDDETHFVRTISIVSMFDSVKYEAENKLVEDFPQLNQQITDKTYSYESLREYSQTLDGLYDRAHADNQEVLRPYDEATIGYKSLGGIYSIAYIVPAIAIIIGKGLHLSFAHVFLLGKISILLAYTMIIYYAIKRLRYGKILMSVIALLPTSMVLASSYSYDWWVIALTLAGTSYYIGNLQRPEETLQYRDLFMMVACFALSIMPKWVYCVMLLPLFFFPKEKFKDKRQRGVWYAFLIGGMAIIFFLFVLPVLHHGLGMGDTRGGEGINASEQLWWILQLPGSYLQKLIGFMAGYLGFNVAPLYTTNMGYLGQGDYGILLLILIAVILYLDRGEEKRKVTWLRISQWATLLILVAVIVTVFYLVYTPVGGQVLQGCQGRYLLPVLFPLAYSLGIDGISIKFDKNHMVMAALGLTSLVFLLDYYTLYISYL